MIIEIMQDITLIQAYSIRGCGVKKSFVILLMGWLCINPTFAQKETNYERLNTFSSAIGDVSTTVDELITRYGKGFVLEEQDVKKEDFPNAEEGSKIYKYSFKNGAVFIFYHNPGMKPFLTAWIVQPGFSASMTIPSTIEACRNWFGKEQLLIDNDLYYFFEWTLVFSFENGQLSQLAWSSDN